MDINLIEKICEEKKLTCMETETVDDLYIFEKKNNFNYRDIIGIYYIEEDIMMWNEIEGKFISIVEKILSREENEFAVEPYLIFFIDKERYFKCLEEIVKIERDEFYCRKFVYPIEDENNIIEKLPFGSPLTFQIKRRNFVTAEKTLINLGMDRIRAQILTKKFISDELKEQAIEYFRNFKLEKSVRDSIIKDKVIKNNVRLKEMKVQGFRIYGKEETFDLDADLVVLYGANGLGKTSFFDAFEYGLTEEIKRFSKKEDKSDIIKMIKNFAVDNNDDVKIRLKFEVSSENGSEDFMFERIMKQTRVNLFQPEGGTKKEETKNVLNKITQKNISLKKDEIVKLFRATHIYNQDNSELTENAIKGSSSISNEILGRMISFEDYTDVDDNLKKLINKNSEKIKKELKPELRSLEDKVIELKNKYNLQQNILQNGQNSEAFLKLQNELMLKIMEIYNISMEILEKEFVENKLTSRIEADLNSLAYEINNINEAIKYNSELTKIKNNINKMDLEKTRQDIKNIKYEIVTIEQQEMESKSQKNIYESKLKKKEKILVECSRYIEIYLNISTIKENIQVLNSTKKDVETKVEQLQKKAEEINEEEISRRTQFLTLDSDLYNEREIANDIEEIYICFDKYEKDKYRNKTLSIELKNYAKNIEELTKQKESLNIEISNLNAEISNIELEFKQQQKENSEIENLLLSIKKHVNKKYCPVCDSEFDAPEDIIGKIDRKIENISEYQKIKQNNITNFKEEKVLKEKQYSNIASTLNSIKKIYSELIKEQEEISISNEKFELRLNELGLSDEKNEIKSILDDKRTTEKIALEKLNKNFAIGEENEKIFENFQKELVRKREELSEINNNILSQNNLIDVWNKKLFGLDNIQEFYKMDFENISVRLELLKQINNEIEAIKGRIKEVEKKRSLLNNNKETLEKDLLKLERELEELNKVNDSYKQVELKLLLMRDTQKVDIDNLSIAYKNKSERISMLNSLKSKAFIYLKMVEYESLSAEQKNLIMEIDDCEKRIKIKGKEIYNYEQINEKIIKIQKEVKSVQHNIVNNYCKNVEPLVSIIQSRLRTLYGFTDLSLSLDKDKDEVNINTSHYALVEKKEQNNEDLSNQLVSKNQLKPFSYLSEAQKNIINLSLFLSNTLSQNWSGFQTIFLDDPIQHFDDLNAYAFLELIKSLMLDDDGIEKKQIIISTCDNKFFNLIKGKFNMLRKKGRAKYYVFESINKDGPVIKRL